MRSEQRWHATPVEEVTEHLSADSTEGLSAAAAAQRQQRYGLNRLTEHKGMGPVKRFLLQFHQPLVYILLSAVAVTLALQEWVDAAVIAMVVLLNAIIGFVQEAKALRAINALSKRLHSVATVIRDGQRQSIAADQLVPGDLVVLQPGDKVPADMRLIKSRDLQIDESALTGESVPAEKTTAELPADSELGDRRNMGYSSTLVTYGTGLGLVTGIGDDTEIGKISALIATTQTLDTPLTKRIKQFSHLLLYAILALAGVTLLVGWLHGGSLLETFMAAVALAVGAIPEGLPAAVTIMLAIGVSRMARRRAIIRNLPAVETLGSTTVICSDKTGTLTKNEMTVRELWSGAQLVDVSGDGYDPHGEFYHPGADRDPGDVVDAGADAALRETLTAGLLCNEASLLPPADADAGATSTAAQWQITGDPTEGALLVSAHKAGLTTATAQARFEKIDTIPFQSEYQYMATLCRDREVDTCVIYIKGSLESVLPKCDSVLDSGGRPGPIDAADVQRRAEEMAARGLRVLAFARKRAAAGSDTLEHEDVAGALEFLGLQAMIDPPRPEAARAVAACHRAGIAVKMITGDHALTAVSIARQLGIVAADEKRPVVTGRELTDVDAGQLEDLAGEVPVFARVSPDHKLQLVKALQAGDQVVAMTGDGVNDAPALRRADIGVAMALNGTEVAREAADMMLTDDNFATIRAAVEEGRSVFDNLKKFIVWTLPTNGGEALVILVAVLLGISLPLLPVHILWVNMTTAICLGLMLAFEPAEANIMERPPHQPNTSILDSTLLWRILLVSSLLSVSAFGLFELELLWGATETEARTVAVAMFVVGEAFYLFNCRSLTQSVFKVGFFSNPWIWFGIAVMAILQLLFTYLPVMNQWFDTAPIGIDAWLRILACGLMISLIIGLEKHWRQRSGPADLGGAQRAEAMP
ncbi:HAD-IC family P-type ATPase [Exilibacterium tricleocarpae]|uniref:HAD-IC family P-type ATPase n=1 Tax=Exilibacterium tricleocarpae TaxID=2591008 RepID=A0A545U6U2_9GAMM|nr:HAD-IC family P-type ATPase [Exilibacterium tricleocarpae]TQV85123.1 HAD-IC family P-type ATPase [Exilibacterium tricleocarpae]